MTGNTLHRAQYDVLDFEFIPNQTAPSQPLRALMHWIKRVRRGSIPTTFLIPVSWDSTHS